MLMVPLARPLLADPDAVLPLLGGDGPARRERLVRLALFGAWLLVAGWLAHEHVFWRDEVRAFSLALSGDSTMAMLRNIQGEGHPALWYLLLRGVHALLGSREALPITAFALGAAAAGLWAWRAPFRPLVIALVLFGGFCLHEYTVLARNYGMSMLLMFAFAALYPRWRERGVGLGLLLVMLSNTNAPSVLLAGALGLFWMVEIATGSDARSPWRWRHWAVNMGLMLLGVLAFLAEVYPPYNDAAVSPLAGQITPTTLLMAAVNIAAPFSELVPETWWNVPLSGLLLTAMVVGAPLGLIRSPAGLLAGLAATIAMPLFFQVVYPGGYRHQALFIVFLLTLYWLVATGNGGRWPARPPVLRPTFQRVLQRFGHGALLALLVVQVAMGVAIVLATAQGVPYSRAKDLGALLTRETLTDAVVIANPDVMLEPLPYYAPNPIWLTRERRWGHVVAFTKPALREVTTAELLATARALRARTGRPVVIVSQVPLDPAAPPTVWDHGYTGTFRTTPVEIAAFLHATRRLASFDASVSGEFYDVYLLR